MRLLDLDKFAAIFEPYAGKCVGYVRGHGNVGDQLIVAATMQLMREFKIDVRLVEPQQIAAHSEVVMLAGGGSLGNDAYPWETERRREARKRAATLGIPVVILPQTAKSASEGRFDGVYVRDRASLAFYPEAMLTPDLALGYDYLSSSKAERGLGIFLRSDVERTVVHRRSQGDPAELCATHDEYLRLAAKFTHIITNRLHFAICGLLNRRKVTLLANSYSKNRSVWETWLRELGCDWSESIDEVLAKVRPPRFAKGSRCGTINATGLIVG